MASAGQESMGRSTHCISATLEGPHPPPRRPPQVAALVATTTAPACPPQWTIQAAPPPCALPCCTWQRFAATAAATGMPVQIRCPSLQQLRRHVCRLAGRGVGCAGRQQRLALRHVLDDVVLYKGWGGWVGGWVAGLVAWWDEEWVAAAEPCLDMTGRMGGCRPTPQRSNAGVEPAAATSGGGGPALHTCTSAFCTYTAAGARGNRAGGSQ